MKSSYATMKIVKKIMKFYESSPIRTPPGYGGTVRCFQIGIRASICRGASLQGRQRSSHLVENVKKSENYICLMEFPWENIQKL
jgi:hypothetical protein